MAIVFLYNVHLLNFVHILCTVHAHKTARDASNKISPATIFLGPTNINLVVRRWELSRHGRKHQVWIVRRHGAIDPLLRPPWERSYSGLVLLLFCFQLLCFSSKWASTNFLFRQPAVEMWVQATKWLKWKLHVFCLRWFLCWCQIHADEAKIFVLSRQRWKPGGSHLCQKKCLKSATSLTRSWMI